MKDDPMFPIVTANGIYKLGLTKREYFAARALGLCERPNIAVNWTEEDVAKSAVVLADALIKELGKEMK